MGLILNNGLVLADADVIVADRFRGLCLYLARIKVSSDFEGGSRVFCSGTKWLLLLVVVRLLRLLLLPIGAQDDFSCSEPVDTLEVLLPLRTYCPLGNCCSLLLNSVVRRLEGAFDRFGPGQLPRPGLDLTSLGSLDGNCNRLLFKLLLLLLFLFLSKLSRCFINTPTVCNALCRREMRKINDKIKIRDILNILQEIPYNNYILLGGTAISRESYNINQPSSTFPHCIYLRLKILQSCKFVFSDTQF